MAQMELQLSTQKAINALEAFEKKLGSTQSALGSLTTGVVGKVATELVNLKNATPNQNHAKSISAYATAINKLGNAKSLTTLTAAMQSLAGLNVGNAALSITALGNALASIKSPRSLKAFVDQVVRLAAVSRGAATRITALATAINSIQVPGSMRSLPGSLQRIGQSASQAGGGIRMMGTELRLMGGIAAGLGVRQLYAMGKEIYSASTQAADGMTAFSAKMQAAGHNAKSVADQYEWLASTSNKLAIPMEVAQHAFSKLSISMQEVGMSSKSTQRVFEGFSTGFRAMGLTTEQTGRAFNAVSQMFTKGSVTMEELRQQLGEVFPAFGLLAKSMGVTTMELAKMMAQGQVSSAVLEKMADDIKAKFTPALEYMAKSGVAAMIRLENALLRLSAFSGESLYRGMRDGIESLSTAMNSVPVQNLAAALGGTLGFALGVAAGAVGILAESLGYAVMFVQTFWESLVQLGTYLASFVGGAETLAIMTEGFGGALGTLIPILGGAGIALYGVSKAFQAVRWVMATTAAVAIMPFLMGLGALVIGLTGLGATILLVKSAWDAWQQGISFSEAFNSNIAAAKEGMTQLAQAALSSTQVLQNSLADGLKSVAAELDINAAATKDGAAAYQDLGNAAQSSASGINSASDAASGSAAGNQKAAMSSQDAAQAFIDEGRAANKLKADLSGVEDTSRGAASGCSACASAADDAGSSMSSAASDAARLASGYDKVAASASNAASAQSRVKGGGGGGRQSRGALDDADSTYTTEFDFSSDGMGERFGSNLFRNGGIVGKGSSSSMSVPASAFIGAPRLATGIANTNSLAPSLAGGGIPSILHPNEAVVPLPNGGSIPVQFSGGGGGGGGADMATMRSINSILGSYLSIFSTWSLDVLTTLKKIHTTLTGESRTGSGISTGGGSFGGGGSLGSSTSALASNFMTGLGTSGASAGGGGGGSNEPGKLTGEGQINGFSSGTWSEYQNLQQAVQAANAKLAASEYELEGVRYNGGPVMYAPQKMIQVQERAQAARDAASALSLFQKANPAFMAMLNGGKKIKNMTGIGTGMGTGSGRGGIGDFLGGYADGTPNTSKEMRGGGMNAVLHPNEAVIPLPDGRSVPVQLPQAMQRMLNEGGAAGGGGGPRVTNVTMNITTPDANSFAKSQTQIQNELRANIARTQERSGPPSRRIEDPTRRMAQVK